MPLPPELGQDPPAGTAGEEGSPGHRGWEMSDETDPTASFQEAFNQAVFDRTILARPPTTPALLDTPDTVWAVEPEKNKTFMNIHIKEHGPTMTLNIFATFNTTNPKFKDSIHGEDLIIKKTNKTIEFKVPGRMKDRTLRRVRVFPDNLEMSFQKEWQVENIKEHFDFFDSVDCEGEGDLDFCLQATYG